MTDSNWDGRGVLILGAVSAIAEAVARNLASQGARLALVARDPARLDGIAADLRVRGAQTVTTRALDLVEVEPTEALFEAITDELGGLHAVIIAHGFLPSTSSMPPEIRQARKVIDVNFASAALWALASVQYLERACGESGVVAAIGSVAGDRGRSSNFVYGAAKAGLAVLMQGLAHRHALHGGPRAVVFKLGFVDTPMTDGMAKDGPLWSQPTDIARLVVKGLSGSAAIVYGPWYWRYIALVIRLLPEPLMRRLDL